MEKERVTRLDVIAGGIGDAIEFIRKRQREAFRTAGALRYLGVEGAVVVVCLGNESTISLNVVFGVTVIVGVKGETAKERIETELGGSRVDALDSIAEGVIEIGPVAVDLIDAVVGGIAVIVRGSRRWVVCEISRGVVREPCELIVVAYGVGKPSGTSFYHC